MEIRFARSATKHRISRDRALYVIAHAGLRFELQPELNKSDQAPRLIIVGDDHDGVAIEVVAVPSDVGDLVVIHAMKLGRKHREMYEEAVQWRI